MTRRDQLERVANALWELRGTFNAGVVDPGEPSTTLEAEILASFASYASCVVDEDGFNEDTFEGLRSNLKRELNKCPIMGLIGHVHGGPSYDRQPCVCGKPWSKP